MGLINLTVLVLVFSLYSLWQLRVYKVTSSATSQAKVYKSVRANLDYVSYAALPQASGTINADIKSDDARSEILYQYLQKRRSPLAPYADQIVNNADANEIDFRLPVAIAECESNLCEENKFPEGSYNCWGYGIHSRGTLKFSSYEEGIQKVIVGLKKFKDRGYMTSVEKLMELYTPPSIPLGGPWAKCVSHFMDKLK